MANFDALKATGYGFRTIMAERKYLVRLAMIPVLMKVVLYSTVVALDWQSDFIRQALVMLPSYFVEGWMLAHFVRLLLLDQRWPYRPVSQDQIDLQRMMERARGVMAGALAFATIKFITAGITAGSYIAYEKMGLTPDVEITPDPRASVVAFVFLILAIWSFRFLWLYIPAAANAPVRTFLRPLRGMGASFSLIATWLICFLPIFVIFRIVLSILLIPFAQAGQIPPAMEYVVGAAVVLMDTVHTLVTTAAIVWGVRAATSHKR